MESQITHDANYAIQLLSDFATSTSPEALAVKVKDATQVREVMRAIGKVSINLQEASLELGNSTPHWVDEDLTELIETQYRNRCCAQVYLLMPDPMSRWIDVKAWSRDQDSNGIVFPKDKRVITKAERIRQSDDFLGHNILIKGGQQGWSQRQDTHRDDYKGSVLLATFSTPDPPGAEQAFFAAVDEANIMMVTARLVKSTDFDDRAWTQVNFDSQKNRKKYPTRKELMVLSKDNAMMDLKRLCLVADTTVKRFNVQYLSVQGYPFSMSEETIVAENAKQRRHELLMAREQRQHEKEQRQHEKEQRQHEKEQRQHELTKIMLEQGLAISDIKRAISELTE
jgi:hypothetical protein